MHDKRSLKILFETYWSSKGWKMAGHPNWVPQTPPDDLKQAISQGVMFPPRKMSHTAVLDRLSELRTSISPLDVGSAFVASLTSGSLAQRSALGTYSVFLNLPQHRSRAIRTKFQCDICGFCESADPRDLNVLSFERWKWGGVRFEDPFYAAFDLERFASEPVAEPSKNDWATLSAILECVDSMPVGAKLAALVEALKPLVPGNPSVRRNVISILGFTGVLKIPDHPGFFSEFTPAEDREETSWHKDDWNYPIRWWRGGNGLNHKAISFWFGSHVKA